MWVEYPQIFDNFEEDIMKDSIFGHLGFQNHTSLLLVTYVDSPGKKMVQPDGLRVVKGAHSLGQQVERNKRL
jgi:hypothetical protein